MGSRKKADRRTDVSVLIYKPCVKILDLEMRYTAMDELTDIEKQGVKFLVKSLDYLLNHKDMDNSKLDAMIDVFITQGISKRHVSIIERKELHGKIKSIIDKLRE
jgi:hypothetical protein